MKNNSKINKVDILDAILNSTNEAIVYVDENAKIQVLSKEYAKFLGVNSEEAIGQDVRDVIENTRMHIVLKTGLAEYADIQSINGKNMIASRIPTIKNGKVVGAFGRVLFQNTKELKEIYKKINNIEMELNLYKDNFTSVNKAVYRCKDIITVNKEMIQIKNNIKEVAKTSSNVLILGESGTGKELIAHSIHSESDRSNYPFISLNCAAIPSNLLESELFGYADGAFTGAKKGGKIGLFQAADNGTIFLDEIGEMSKNLQAKLLRVLEDKKVTKLGSNKSEIINMRLVVATNQDLSEMVKEGKFREDLYYRLNVVNFNIPPLRKRTEDIIVLSKYLIKKISKKENIKAYDISSDAMDALKAHDWPGNVRELENVLEASMNFLANETIIRLKHLPKKISKQEVVVIVEDLKTTLDNLEKEYILNALNQCNNNKTKVAKVLNISRTSLYEKIKKYNLDV